MTILSHTYYSTFKWRTGICVSLVILTLALMQDVLHASFKGYTFYLSESLLFNSFWLMFLPLIYLQAKCSKFTSTRYKKNILLAIVLPAALFSLAQLLLYPLLYLYFPLFFSTILFRWNKPCNFPCHNICRLPSSFTAWLPW